MEDAGQPFDAPADGPATPGERLHVAELALRAALTSTAAEARTLALRALADGRLLDDPGPLPLLVFKAPIALLFADALEEATGVFGELIDRAQRSGSMMMFAQASHMRAAAWWRRGALAEAEADADAALRYPSPQLRPAALTLVEIRHDRTIRLREASEKPQLAVVDLGAPGPSAGDHVVTTDGVLRPNGAPVGTISQVCTLVTVGPNLFASTFDCSGSFDLEDGSITVQGSFVPAAPENAFAVTGGTGEFRGARGDGVLRADADEITIKLIYY